MFMRLVLGEANGSWQASREASYFFLLIGALLLGIGISAALVVLLPRTGFRLRGGIYILFLGIVLPLSWYNYDQGDNVLRASIQLALNLLLIFLSATTALWLSSAPAAAPDIKVLKGLALVSVLTAGVFVPALFTFVWCLLKARLLDPKQLEDISLANITGLSGVASAVIAGLNYWRGQRQSKSDQEERLVRL
jgi:hypothetical protein